MDPLYLDLEFCRKRQLRLMALLSELKRDRAVLTRPEHVQYFTGFRPHKLMGAIVEITADGPTTLAAPNQEPERHAADRVLAFVAQHHCTLRQDMMVEAANVLGVDHADDDCLRQHLWTLRRKKDSDELAMMRRGIGPPPSPGRR